MTDTAIETTEAAPLATVQPVTIDALLGAALVEGRSADELNQLHELYRTRKADLAREAFNQAFVQFKKDCPPIPRSIRTEQYKRVTTDGREVPGSYADLEGIEAAIGETLLACGLSYRWIDTQIVDGEMVVTCRLAHVDGYYEDSPSPPFSVARGQAGQSPQQVSASVSTYARRYSLISALGLTTVDPDDDGRGKNAEPVETITEEQANGLNDLIIQACDGKREAVEASKARLYAKYSIDALGGVPANDFDAVCAKVQEKISATRSKA
ncbi:MAG: ERF family protein [Planctomycetota bacterium]|jgi:hypothetical protein